MTKYKQVKLTKKMLSKHPADLLIAIGAVNAEKTAVYPQHVYFSKEDYKALEKTVRKMVNKEMSFFTQNKKDMTFGMEMLNYGPNESLKDALRPGYALIDEESIKKESTF